MAAGDGLISMTPTSIAHAGTSASINADGGVDFTAVTSLSLNGVFTGDYDNYLMVVNFASSAAGNGLRYKLRAGGTDTTGSDYTDQALGANSTTVSGTRSSSQTSASITITGTTEAGCHLQVYGPFLTQPTAARSATMVSWNTATIYDYASTHSASTSYDGVTVFLNSGTFTGTIHVFGYEE